MTPLHSWAELYLASPSRRQVIFGASVDPTLPADEIVVTLIATGMESSLPPPPPPPPAPLDIFAYRPPSRDASLATYDDYLRARMMIEGEAEGEVEVGDHLEEDAGKERGGGSGAEGVEQTSAAAADAMNRTPLASRTARSSRDAEDGRGYSNVVAFSPQQHPQQQRARVVANAATAGRVTASGRPGSLPATGQRMRKRVLSPAGKPTPASEPSLAARLVDKQRTSREAEGSRRWMDMCQVDTVTDTVAEHFEQR